MLIDVFGVKKLPSSEYIDSHKIPDTSDFAFEHFAKLQQILF